MHSLRIFICCAILCILFLRSGAKLESAQLSELLAATTGATIVDTSDPLTVGTASLNLASLSALNDPIDTSISDEQSRINTLARSFRRLPQRELDEFYASIAVALAEHGDGIIEPDSELAKKLQIAWEQRQVELKAALNAIVKPPELMKRLMSAIRVDTASFADKEVVGPEQSTGTSISSTQDALPSKQDGLGDSTARRLALQELPTVLDDVDNARDFHTMGGFAVLAQALAPEHKDVVTDEERGLAALAIGNSIKNQYEFQVWVLDKEMVLVSSASDTVTETSEGKSLKARSYQYYPSLLSSLLHLLETGSDQSRRSAMYAVSSAARGNLDVQAALRDNMAAVEPAAAAAAAPVDISYLLLQRLGNGSAELRRKIYAFISDMLEEFHYIQEQIRNPENFLIDGDASGQELELMKQLHALRPLGKGFCTAQWESSGWHSLDAAVQALVTETAEAKIQECLAVQAERTAKDSEAAVAESESIDDIDDNLLAHCSPSVLFTAEKRPQVTAWRALAENALSTLRHMRMACPQSAQDEAEAALHSRSLRDVRAWAQRVGDFAGEVDQLAARLQAAPDLAGPR